MTKRILLMTAMMCFGHGLVIAQGLDGLYLQMIFRFNNLEENHYFFLPDGRYLNGVPEEGLAPGDMDRTCAKPASACGTYKLNGGTLLLTPAKGRPESVTLAREAEGNLTLDGLFAKHVASFPAGAKLDGAYSSVGNAGPVSAARGFTFRPDGTFSSSSLGAVTTEQGSKKSESSATGTYRLGGNVLELTFNGSTTRMVAYPYDLGKGDVRLSLNGRFYKK